MTHLLLVSDGVCVESDSVGRAVVPDGFQHVHLLKYISSFAGLVFDFVIFTPFCYFERGKNVFRPGGRKGLAPCRKRYSCPVLLGLK